MKTRTCFSLLAATGLLVLTGCKSTPQMTNRPDFLSTYTHLQKVDATTWRYISQPLLANCGQFTIDPVKVMIPEFQGKPLTDDQRQRSGDFVRQTMINALAGHYPVVAEPGPGVGEIRIAVTEAYGTGGKLGLSVQGEILDNSKTQVGAVVRTELSQYYTPDWQDKAAAREMVEEWAQRLLKAIDQAHGK